MSDHPEKRASENPYAAPVHAELAGPKVAETDATGGLIPYKNPHALIGYYLGYLGLLPVIGIPLAIAAIVLGTIGLRKRRQQPQIKGSGHAIFAIVAGSLGLLCGVGLLAMLVLTVFTAP